jgi:hypothetical protein
MPLDNHLFADLQEGASKNVALIYHIKEKKKPRKNEPPDPNPDPDADIKYSFSTPKNVFNALQRTIKLGCLLKKQINEDLYQVFNDTRQQIIDAKGTYIEDSLKKIAWHGIRGQAEALNRRQTQPINPGAMDGFNHMLVKLENGDGVSFVYDLTGDEEEAETELPATLVMTGNKDDEGDDIEEVKDDDNSNEGG